MLEKEESKKVITKNTVVKMKYIQSSEYSNKIRKLESNTKVARSIRESIIEILSHRSGTDYEDLVYIDSKTGKYIINKNYNVVRQAKPNKSMNDLLNKTKDYSIIAIHNHPSSSVPSIADFKTCVERKYKYEIVACHDGNILLIMIK